MICGWSRNEGGQSVSVIKICECNIKTGTIFECDNQAHTIHDECGGLLVFDEREKSMREQIKELTS